MKPVMPLLALVLTLSSLTANADHRRVPNLQTLPEDAVALSPIKAELVSQEPLCPDGVTCFANGTIVHLAFSLNGCLDELAPVQYSARVEDGVVKLSVSALNVHTASSTKVMCIAQPVKAVTLTLVNMYGTVELLNLDTQAFRIGQ